MAINEKNGKYRSERTSDEITKILQDEINELSEDEREFLSIAMKELGDTAFRSIGDAHAGGGPPRLIDTLADAEYLRPMVDMRTFIKDPYYLGVTSDSLFDRYLDDLTELFDGDYREAIFTGSIGAGKCVKSDTCVYDTRSGMRRRVDEIGELSVPSMRDDGTIRSMPATAFPSGRKECVEVRLANGSAITLSADHKIFTTGGWIEAGLLSEGDLVATPRSMPAPDSFFDISEEEIKLVGYLMGDGGCTGTTTFTNANNEIVNEFKELVSVLGDSSSYRPCQQHIVPGVAPTKSQNAGLATTFSARGIRSIVKANHCNARAKDKQLPAWFYGLSNRNISLFLNRFIACDGHVNTIRNKIEIVLASEKLIDDLIFLLLRLGVRSRKRYKESSIKVGGVKKKFDSWQIVISEVSNVIKFLDEVGDIFGKVDESRALRFNCESIRACPNTDIVPVGNSELRSAKEWLKERGMDPGASFVCPPGQMLSRGKFERFVAATGYNGEYAWHARSDIAWEQIREIVNVGMIDVYDLSVPVDHNFVGNNVILHNTFTGSIALCRVLYEMSCLRDIHRSFGIARDTNLALVALSVNEALAIRVVFENVATKISQSPYFLEHFPFEETKTELRFPHNIMVAARSTTDTANLGLNVFGGIMDECLTYGSKVLLSDGSQRSIGDLYAGCARFEVSTFDFRAGEQVSTPAYVKQSTVQNCYSVELSSGQAVEVSWNHPIAVRNPDGSFEFKLTRDIVIGDEVVTFERDYGELEEYGGIQTDHEASALRGDKAENKPRSEGQDYVRGDQGKDVGFRDFTSKEGRLISASPMPGELNPMFGAHHSLDVKEVIASKRRGKKASPETKAKMSASRRGKQMHTQEFKDRLTAYNRSRKGVFKHSEETKEKISRSSAWLLNKGDFRYLGYTETRFGRIGFRSYWERRALEMLHHDASVLSVKYESMRIPYVMDGKNRNTVPDYVIQTNASVRSVMIEVKPKGYMGSAKEVAKREASMRYCMEYGLDYAVWTEDYLWGGLPPKDILECSLPTVYTSRASKSLSRMGR